MKCCIVLLLMLASEHTMSAPLQPNVNLTAVDERILLKTLVKALRRFKHVEMHTVVTLEHKDDVDTTKEFNVKPPEPTTSEALSPSPIHADQGDVETWIREGNSVYREEGDVSGHFISGMPDQDLEGPANRFMLQRPSPGDEGVCSTQVKEDFSKFGGYLFSQPDRWVALAEPIYPKDIECRFDRPPSNYDNRCLMVGYPHGAWIAVPQEEFKEKNWKRCEAGVGNAIKCWDYVIVPGYCVMSKNIS